MKKYFIIMLTIFASVSFISCRTNDDGTADEQYIDEIADIIWTYGQSHPDGFTLDIQTMTEATEGVAAAYSETQNSHSREQLNLVVSHSLSHDGYVGGWYNSSDSLYYFDSVRLFAEDSLKEAVSFAKENQQYSVFILSSGFELPVGECIYNILERDTLLVGTTGDYRPLTFLEPATGSYWGFGIDLTQEIANRIGVEIRFVSTSWPTLTEDVLVDPQLFDFAIGGITITDSRCEKMLMSDGYLANGKTILCRVSDADRFKSLADIDKPEVRVMVNPGGLNEKFANENLRQATIIVHPKNEEIPALVAENKADIMITEITEAPYYVKTDSRLAAPLLETPFTRGEIGVLMRKGQDDLLEMINSIISQMKTDGSLRLLHEKYDLVYAYE